MHIWHIVGARQILAVSVYHSVLLISGSVPEVLLGFPVVLSVSRWILSAQWLVVPKCPVLEFAPLTPAKGGSLKRKYSAYQTSASR